MLKKLKKFTLRHRIDGFPCLVPIEHLISVCNEVAELYSGIIVKQECIPLRTVRCSGRLLGGCLLGRGGGGLPGGVCLARGDVCPGGVHLPPVDRQTPVKT